MIHDENVSQPKYYEYNACVHRRAITYTCDTCFYIEIAAITNFMYTTIVMKDFSTVSSYPLNRQMKINHVFETSVER